MAFDHDEYLDSIFADEIRRLKLSLEVVEGETQRWIDKQADSAAHQEALRKRIDFVSQHRAALKHQVTGLRLANGSNGSQGSNGRAVTLQRRLTDEEGQ